MRDIWADDSNIPSPQHALIAVDPERELTLNHRPSLLFGVLMFMHVGRSGSDGVARKRHPLAVNRFALPAGDRFERNGL